MDIQEILSHPQPLHSVLVHIPIALTTVGIVLVWVAAATSDTHKTLRWVAALCYLIAAITAYGAGFSGSSAREQISGALPSPVWAAISHHEYLSRQIWKLALATAGLLTLSASPWAWCRSSGIYLAVGVSAACAIWTGVATYDGARLVYHYGLGVPPSVAPLVSPLAQRKVLSDKTAKEIQQIVPVPVGPVYASQAATVSYADDVRLTVAEGCAGCDSPDKTQGEYDTTRPQSTLAGVKSGNAAIVPGT